MRRGEAGQGEEVREAAAAGRSAMCSAGRPTTRFHMLPYSYLYTYYLHSHLFMLTYIYTPTFPNSYIYTAYTFLHFIQSNTRFNYQKYLHQ